MGGGRRPRERIVPLPALGELLAGRPDRPLRPVLASSTSTAGWSSGAADDLPGGENERFLEYWNLVFMQYDQDPIGTLTPLPQPEHRHGPGPQPDGADPAGRADTIFETDQFAPLMAPRPRARARATPTSARCGSSPTTRAR